ncbi:MAG: S8 family serine peptidase [Verrucomicrobia bacterium]|nr:S8 family serine peptidase [Verrucomicrobiota bacterium]
MTPTFAPARRCLLFLVLLLSILTEVPAQTKSIRLRNEVITTSAPSPNLNLQPQAAEAVVSGLYLVQLDGPLQIAWRARLASLGVDLLRFVPDDAFVARVEAARLSQLRALPFVRWVGEYRPEHKTHRALHSELAGASTNALVPISLLLSPHAPSAEILKTTRVFQLLREHSPSKFGSILRGQVTPAQLGQLAKSDSVLWIESAPRMKLIDEIASKIVGGGEYAPSTGAGGGLGGDGGDLGLESLKLQAAPAQTNQHATVVQQLGFDGSGVVVCVADSGLNNGDAATMHPDLAGRVDAFFFYCDLLDASDEHSHGTHVAGIIAGNGATGETDDRDTLYGLGVASNAHLVAQRIFDADGKDYLPPYETLTHDAVRAGAVIGSNSWGDDVNGRYDLSAAQFDALVRDADAETPDDQPYILEFSAGNAGPGAQTLDSPAVAKNVIATGASQNDRPDFFIYADGIEAMADFSSRGPCEDGRIKPDIVAPGTWIASLQSASAPDTSAWLPISPNYQYQGGTSQAGPHASGAAAIFVQYYRATHNNATPSPALVKAALINSATDMDDVEGGTDPIPNMDEGWGRVTLTNIIGSTRKSEFIDQSIILTNGQTFEQRIVSGNPNVPLKITLTYTDVPGFPAAIPALVNDLDLEVVGPDGTVYRGNQFNAGDSIPNPPDRDAINNVEGVHLLAPPPGEYFVRVRAKNIAEDIHGRTNTPPQQDFALVISGDLPLPGEGILIFDRNAYTVPGTIGIKLIDFDLAGQSSVSIPITSDSQSTAAQIKLLPSGSAGVFTGNIATATSPANGALRITDGDKISASYQDASPSGTRTVEAVADLTAPVASAITTTNHFGKAVITWQTDENTRSIIRYGTNANLNLSITNSALIADHGLTLNGVPPGTTNFFLIISVDEAGNISTNNNSGRLFSVVTRPVPPVLLVDAFNDIILNDLVPVSTYLDGLDATGIKYEVWSVADEGRAPVLADLQPYRVVIWRAGEFSGSLTTGDAKAIRDYVSGGGGFFMASMEVLSRLDEQGLTNFRKNVLHVEDFAVDPGVDGIFGVDNTSLTSGVQTDLDFSAYPDLITISLNVSDTFHPTTNAAPILFDNATGRPVGLRFPRAGEESAGRVVYFSFPLDTIPMDGMDPNNRGAILRNVISFLAPGINGLGSIELDREDYSIPARVTIEVADSDLAGSEKISIKLVSDLLPQGQTVSLSETPTAGLFRGFVNLIATNAAAGAGQIRVNDGDIIHVEYVDASAAGRTIFAESVVDSSPPTVSRVKVEPDYSEAIITWDSSEAADSLVQFGESKFLGRTAYSSDLEDTHSVSLTGLLPDRDYFFQVASRDAAGNSIIDDNKGKFYSFRTLKPLTPPFRDDLEHGSTNWTVVNPSVDAETQSILTSSDWQFGKPQNELANAAHSGTNCWGTNLRGEGNDYANSSLASPAIDLSGGNIATLRFWHNYDFTPRNDETDILETAGVYVSTNNGAAWTQLAAYDGSSGGWVEEEVDASAYLGKVVRFGWAYELFSIDAVAHPGWLVDDVSVTVTNIVPGTIQISNNLAQASFVLDGPIARNGQGLFTSYTNAPPGEYVITFSDVPFYQTPKPQTNTLAATKLLVFAGQYTFADANNNGISDAWEKLFFGAVSPTRTKSTDTDGDGASDYQEFLAGTNPTNATSVLRASAPIRQSGGALQIAWPSIIGQAYRVEGSTNAVAWNPLTDWFRALRTNSTYTVRNQTSGAPYLFRISTRP